MANDNQALEKIENARPLGISRTIGLGPRSFEEAWRFAKMIAGSDLAPKDYKGNPENVLVAIQMGAEVGLPPMAAIQNIAVINGRPSLWGDAALGVVQVHSAYESHHEFFEGTGENKTAVFEVTRKGSKLHTTKFSVSDAKKAGLWGKAGPWTNYPDRMLQMRARGFGLRDKFADALRGLGIAEEALDMPPISVIEAADFTPDTRPALPDTIHRASEPVATPDPMNDARIAKEKLEGQAKLDRARAEAGVSPKPEPMEHVTAAASPVPTSPRAEPESSTSTAEPSATKPPEGVRLNFRE